MRIHRTRRAVRLVAMGAAAAVLAACGSSGGTGSEPDSQSSQSVSSNGSNPSAATAKTVTIKLVDYPNSSVGWLAYLGLQKGIFKENHLNVELVPLPAGQNAPSALIGGSVQVAPIDLFNVGPLLTKDVKLKLLVNTGVTFWTLVGKKGSNTSDLKQELQSLAGKSIASPSVAGSGARFFKIMADAYGVNASSIAIVADPTNATLTSGRTDAAMTDDIGACRLETMGYPELMSFISPPNPKSTYPEVVQSLIGLAGLGYWTTDKWASDNPNTVTAFQDSIEKTMQWAQDPANLDEVASIMRASKRNVPSISDSDWTGCVKKVLSGWNDKFTTTDAASWAQALKLGTGVTNLPPSSEWFAKGMPTS